MTVKLWSARGLRQHVFERPRFLCDPLVPSGGIALIHGPSESGKTQLVMTLIKALLEGGTFLHQFPCQRARVLLVEADTPMLAIQDRLARLPLADALWNDFAVLADESKSFNLINQSISPDDDVLAAQAFAPDFIVFDALRDLHSLDEIDSRTPRAVYGAARKLFPRQSLSFIHHDRKRATMGTRVPDEEASGTGAWRNASDVSWHLERFYNHKDPHTHYATLRTSKTRWSEKISAIKLRMNDDTLLMEPTEPSVPQLITMWLNDNPGLAEQAIVERLLDDKKCSRATAYRQAKQAISARLKRAVSRGQNRETGEVP